MEKYLKIRKESHKIAKEIHKLKLRLEELEQKKMEYDNELDKLSSSELYNIFEYELKELLEKIK